MVLGYYRYRNVLSRSCHWTVSARLCYLLTSTLFTALPGSIPKIMSVSYTNLHEIALAICVNFSASISVAVNGALLKLNSLSTKRYL